MSIYDWQNVFSGETLSWTQVDHETITFSGGTVLSNPSVAEANAVQEVTIGVEEYDFGVSVELWTALWEWAAVVADNNLAVANGVELARIEADLSAFEIG